MYTRKYLRSETCCKYFSFFEITAAKDTYFPDVFYPKESEIFKLIVHAIINTSLDGTLSITLQIRSLNSRSYQSNIYLIKTPLTVLSKPKARVLPVPATSLEKGSACLKKSSFEFLTPFLPARDFTATKVRAKILKQNTTHYVD